MSNRDRQQESDQTLIFRALTYWANHVETGMIYMSADDMRNQSLKPNTLTEYQMRMVLRLREPARKELHR